MGGVNLAAHAAAAGESVPETLPSGTDVRHAFAQFVTGVVVVVASTDAGEQATAKVQAFSSVSLDPALVLWSLEKSSDAFPVFRRASRFVAHVLAHEQSALMQREVVMSPPNCAGMQHSDDKQGAPADTFAGCSAWFECTGTGYFDGGDHGCFLGRIEHFEFNETRPLITYAGSYRFPGVHPDAHPAVSK